MPVAPNLEKNYVPTVDRIVDYAKNHNLKSHEI
ncbi:hypothetical protein CM15mP35_03370 [bacterium]|nr:MAG: hypothetical protein CM15mP35_03370 [bacterium]